MEKLDFKKELKEFYNPSAKVVSVVEVPEFNYLMIDGCGDPNTSKEYHDAIETLFSLSYAIKFMFKKGSEEIDYGVMPLEGLWWVEDMREFDVNNKADWKWTAMIMQPKFVTKEIVLKAIEEVGKKKKLASLDKVRFEVYKEGLSVQIMHIGPFSEEKPTVDKLHGYISENNYKLSGKHHEIYLSDFRKAAPEKLKTVVRQPFVK